MSDAEPDEEPQYPETTPPVLPNTLAELRKIEDKAIDNWDWSLAAYAGRAIAALHRESTK